MNLTRYVVIAVVMTFAIGSPVYAYKEAAVSDGGTLTGTVKLDGQVPKPKGYNLTTLPDQFYCGRISDGEGWRILQPFNVGPEGEFREVLVYLEGVEKGKPFEDEGARQIEAKDCLFLPFTTVVRDSQSVTVVNMDPVMHDIQAYETSHLGPRVLFNVPLPMNPAHPRNLKDRSDAGMYHKHMAGAPMKQLVNLSKGRRVFVMQCGFHAYMESWGVAVSNPYFAKTDEQGRFTLTDVPPGTYKLVVWHPYVRSTTEQTVIIGPKGTVDTQLVVPAPTGRLYANEVLDHAYNRYEVTEDTKKEIDPMIEKQSH
ncbi:MAG: carboxypeptidase regulatory-like domain-containing protein [Nitrospira sp.]|nr:carboxypeptidase regulatory-like domain-containing protein [Nitrospira sp.]MDH4369910.1 carboxypeptidase regulatory-like domain-containing protein [Nitrospira sp.]MDH5497350.1 carboxypeptidase regulatory-like domain-containing protein [Nitrospira sp.]MDH5725116.1 carboxypeptidase regulatory-like domain-containing protein [Nitrospira sp.]